MSELKVERAIPSADYFLPDLKYSVEGVEPSTASESLKQWLISFIRENGQILASEPPPDIDSYARGCRNALALVMLWIEDIGKEITVNNE